MESVNKTFAELVESAELLVLYKGAGHWRIFVAVDISWEISIEIYLWQRILDAVISRVDLQIRCKIANKWNSMALETNKLYLANK